MDIRPCPNCHRTGRLLRSTADGSLQHYGCDLCGEVWVLEGDVTEKPARDQPNTNADAEDEPRDQ